MTLNNVMSVLQTIAVNHKQINSFEEGDIYDIVSSGSINYPLLHVNLDDVSVGKGEEILSFTFTLMDIVKGGRVNEDEVNSDMLEVAKDIIAMLQSPTYGWEFGQDSIVLNNFTERFADSVAGYTFGIKLVLPFSFNRCSVPGETPSAPTYQCPVVTIYDSNGTILTTVPSGGSYTDTGGGSGSSTVQNSDASYSTTVNSGDTLTLPDNTYRVYVNGNLNSTQTGASVKNQIINITWQI